MPHVATSPADLLAALPGRGPSRRRPPRHRRRGGVPRRRRSATSPGPRRSARTRPTTAAAQWLVWEASQALGARSASIQGLYEARARGEVSGFTVPAINLRAQTFDMARTVYETAAAADVGAVILELARSEQTYTFQRPIDYATSVLAGAIAAGWRGPGLHPGRPLPVQRQEVRRRPRGDDRGDPARLPPRGRRRLPQHRHRLLDARRPVAADTRRGAARELHAAPPS